MHNKFFFSGLKCSFYVGVFITVLSLTVYFAGCSGSDEEKTVDKRAEDSIEVYTNLQKAFALYQKALSSNEAGNDKRAAENFESSLKHLDQIRYETLNNPGNYFWKQDYEELTRSVVQDYLTTQSEISQNSLIFDFAKRVSVTYEKVEKVMGDREPLPDGSEIPLIKNSAVEEYIEFFSNTDRGRSFVDKCLYRSGRYFPIMRKILKFNNAPEELIYLSVQESGLAPTIVSRAGAVGLWQFMPATGYSYGLDQDEHRDDRRDFEKSTDAAARHLKDLYRTYDDWYLAFSAYNAGPGRVNSAINKSGSRDYWSLRGYLPGETRNYVPSILALSFVLRSPEEYGFKDIEYGNPLSYDRVNVKAPISLQKVAELCDSDIETIRELNSEIVNDMLPVYDVAYQIRIPLNSFEKFSANYKKDSDIDKSSEVTPEFAGNVTGDYEGNISLAGYKVLNYEPNDPRKIASKSDRKRVSHEYRPDKPLQAIAIYYEVRPVEIRMWNNIAYGSLPAANQKLDIYISEEKYKLLYGINETEVREENITEKTEETIKSDTYNKETVTKEEVEVTKEKKEVESVTTTEPVITGDANSNTETVTTTDNTSEDEEEYVEEVVSEKPEVKEKVVEKKETSKNTTFYVVKEGDYISTIAKDHGVTTENLMQWNNLESDKILVGQKLKLTSSNNFNKKTSIHTVSEGENLTIIADKYGLSLSELKEMNDISNDKILVGQKLKVTALKNTTSKNSTKTSGVKKTYTVKRGETLASIADDNGVSIQDLMTWNNLKSDKIIVGQVLKLYSEKKKVRKKKN